MQICITITADNLLNSNELLSDGASVELAMDKPETMTESEIMKVVLAHIEKAFDVAGSGIFKTDVYSIIIINQDKFFSREKKIGQHLN